MLFRLLLGSNPFNSKKRVGKSLIFGNITVVSSTKYHGHYNCGSSCCCDRDRKAQAEDFLLDTWHFGLWTQDSSQKSHGCRTSICHQFTIQELLSFTIVPGFPKHRTKSLVPLLQGSPALRRGSIVWLGANVFSPYYK